MQAHGAEAIVTEPQDHATREALIAAAGERRLPLRLAAAVGRRADDLAMLSVAGLGVAFRAAPEVARAAQRRIDHAGAIALLFAQGYRADEIVS